MFQSDWIFGLLGGALIGTSFAMFLLLNGRIAGISGVIDGLLYLPKASDAGIRILFLAGILGAAALAAYTVRQPALSIDVSLPLIGLAGLSVGVGSRMANGCTSGHGVCGVSRGSIRSIVATITFMITAILVATFSIT